MFTFDLRQDLVGCDPDEGMFAAFQPSMKVLILIVQSRMEGKAPRRMAWRDDPEPDFDQVQPIQTCRAAGRLFGRIRIQAVTGMGRGSGSHPAVAADRGSLAASSVPIFRSEISTPVE